MEHLLKRFLSGVFVAAIGLGQAMACTSQAPPDEAVMLHPLAYTLIHNTRSDGEIRVEYLYTESISDLDPTLVELLSGRSSITRAKLADHMRIAFEVCAIGAISGERKVSTETAENYITRNAQFLNQVGEALEAGTLRLVSRHEYENVDSSYQRDLEIVRASLTPHNVEKALGFEPISEERAEKWKARYGPG